MDAKLHQRDALTFYLKEKQVKWEVYLKMSLLKISFD